MRSLGSDALAQIERAIAARAGVGDVKEATVHAIERRARALVGALNREGTHRKRRANGFYATVTMPRALCPLEQVDVDLRGEHLLKAAHVLRAGPLVTVGVEKGTAELDAAAGLHRL